MIVLLQHEFPLICIQGHSCPLLFVRRKCINRIIKWIFLQNQHRISIGAGVCERGLYLNENGLLFFISIRFMNRCNFVFNIAYCRVPQLDKKGSTASHC
jgi:hypothetical protein